MGENVLALKALYVALGGDADDVADLTRNCEVINAIAEIVVPLPAVTAEDNGSVLKVVSGEWAVGTDAT